MYNVADFNFLGIVNGTHHIAKLLSTLQVHSLLKDCHDKKPGAVFPTGKIIHKKLMDHPSFAGKWKLTTTRRILNSLGFRYDDKRISFLINTSDGSNYVQCLFVQSQK